MPVLLIILSVFLLLFLLTLFNIYICASFTDELALTIKIGFVKLRILPQRGAKKKKAVKKKKKSDKSKKKATEKESKNQTSPLDYFKQKGLSGIINIIKLIAEFAADSLRDLFRRITVTDFYLDIKVAGDNAADSAVKYGCCCAALFPALRVIFGAVRCRQYSVNVNPDFSDAPKTEIKARLTAKIRILSVISFALTKAFKALGIYLKAKPKTKKENNL